MMSEQSFLARMAARKLERPAKMPPPPRQRKPPWSFEDAWKGLAVDESLGSPFLTACKKIVYINRRDLTYVNAFVLLYRSVDQA